MHRALALAVLLTAPTGGDVRADEAGPGSIRLDEVALRPPRQRDDGTRVYDAVLVHAGRPLQYGWGEEIPTREALADAAYLEALRGVSVVVHHPPGDGHVAPGNPKSGPGRRVGTVIGARFDAALGEQGGVVVEIAVHEPADQAEVERLGSLSEAYRAQTTPIAPGVAAQTARTPNSVAVTDSPRSRGADIRIDESKEGGAMPTEEKETFSAADVLKMLADEKAATAAQKDRADKAEAEIAKMKADAEAAKEEAAKAAPAEEKKQADAIDRLANERATALLALQRRADSLGVEIPDTVVGLDARTAHVATALGAPADLAPAGRAAFIAGVEKARADSDSRTDREKFIASAATRADARTSTALC